MNPNIKAEADQMSPETKIVVAAIAASLLIWVLETPKTPEPTKQEPAPVRYILPDSPATTERITI